jgi:2-polyprenyl-6-methoxyphenol hydroxylase-like FAD-dependent oxidoreductase
MRTMESVDVNIRGDGAVAMSLALALARQGLRVSVGGGSPRAAPPSSAPDVRAYALNAASRTLLADLKVWDALPADAVTAVHDMHVEGDQAGAAIDFSAWRQGVEALAWIVDAAELDAALRQAVRFAPHLQWRAAGAAEPAAALSVLAEGKDSASRRERGVVFERHAYGQTALAARLVSDRPHAGTARQWFRSPDVLALLPFDRPAPGRSYGLVWSLPGERARALSEAPPAEFEAALAEATGGAAGTLALDGVRALWPLALARADRTCGPGWVLVGDAAHVVHPLAGQGLNLGLADVVTLARVLAAREPWRALGDEGLLRRYARERALPTQAMALLTDGLLHLFAQQQPVLRELRNRGMTLLNHVAPLKRLLTARALDA